MTVMWMELWLLHPKGDLPEAVSPKYKLLRTMIHNNLQHGLSEMFFRIGFYCCNC